MHRHILGPRFSPSRSGGNIAHSTNNTDFVVKPVASGGGPVEFRQSMAPHPLVHQELPYDPHFGIYNRRLRSLEYGQVATEDLYWRLRRNVVLAHTGELATEIRGPDAEAMLNRVFTRDVSRVGVGRCSYQLACLPDGGMIMDGVLLRLAPDRFWYAQGDGEFPLWLHATRRVSTSRWWIRMFGSAKCRDPVQWMSSHRYQTKAFRTAFATSTSLGSESAVSQW